MVTPVLKYYVHTGDCAHKHTHSNPGHSMESFLQKPDGCGMSCNTQMCSKKICKELREEFGQPIIYCSSEECTARACRYIKSLPSSKITPYFCYEVNSEKSCVSCSEIKSTEKKIEKNKKIQNRIKNDRYDEEMGFNILIFFITGTLVSFYLYFF